MLMFGTTKGMADILSAIPFLSAIVSESIIIWNLMENMWSDKQKLVHKDKTKKDHILT